jgi:hypothetical protein
VASRGPTPAARLAVDLAANLLPTPAERTRYRAEFIAELHGLPTAAQLRHAAGVLSQIWALRTALGAAPVRLEEASMQSTIPLGRRFRCRVLRWHHWQLHSTDDGGLYRACSVCGKDHPGPLGMHNTIGA